MGAALGSVSAAGTEVVHSGLCHTFNSSSLSKVFALFPGCVF